MPFFSLPPLFFTLSCFLFFRHARSLAEFPCDATIAASFQRARLSAKIWAFYPALDDDDCTSCFLEFRTALKEMKGKKLQTAVERDRGNVKRFSIPWAPFMATACLS